MEKIQSVLRTIKLTMKTRRWKASNLAKEMGMSESWLSKVLGGGIKLTVEDLITIADILRVPPGILFPVNENIDDPDSKPMTFEEWFDKRVDKALEKKLGHK